MLGGVYLAGMAIGLGSKSHLFPHQPHNEGEEWADNDLD